MARRGETIENPLSGERMTFLETTRDTDGRFFEFALHKDEAYMTGAPIFLQKAFLGTLGLIAPLGRAMGYRARYPKFSGEKVPEERGETTDEDASGTRIGTVAAVSTPAVLLALLLLWRGRSKVDTGSAKP